jgi:hypothetical protein
VTSVTLTIRGTVFVKPHWAVYQPVPHQPVAYQLILDVTGSMSYDFGGHGTVGGVDYQCLTTHPNDPLPYNNSCGPWRTVAERRIYITKQALGQFIDDLDPSDTMQIAAFSTSIGGGAQVLGDGWSSDHLVLKQRVMDAGASNADPYQTTGTASSAQAMQKAGQSWSNGAPITAPDGQAYRHATIFVTDSVADVFLDGQVNSALDVCPEFLGDARARETARCQIDVAGYPASPHGRRPISELIYQSDQIKAASPEIALFVVGLADLDVTGLDQVASAPQLLYLASQPGDVAPIVSEIQGAADPTSTCTETGSSTWIGKIDAAHTADSPPLPSLPSGVYGYVYLTNDQGQPVSVPWSGPGADPRGTVTNMIPIVTDLNGNMTYLLPPSAGLTAGNYHLTGYVNYKAANADPTAGGDGQSRQYSRLMQDGLPVQNISFTLMPSEVLGSSIVIDPLHLDLNLNVNLCG